MHAVSLWSNDRLTECLHQVQRITHGKHVSQVHEGTQSLCLLVKWSVLVLMLHYTGLSKMDFLWLYYIRSQTSCWRYLFKVQTALCHEKRNFNNWVFIHVHPNFIQDWSWCIPHCECLDLGHSNFYGFLLLICGAGSAMKQNLRTSLWKDSCHSKLCWGFT